jgi:Ca-activated chloride channel family protein
LSTLPSGAKPRENQERSLRVVPGQHLISLNFRRLHMLNPRAFYNSRPDGFGVIEIVDDTPNPDTPRRFVPLKRTDLTGTITGPLATLTLTQTFSLSEHAASAIEVLYRFPLPGDAAVTGVHVKFGNVEIHTTLKERETAEKDYREAKQTGRQAALVTRESPDVFTLAIAGLRGGEDIVVQTGYVQVARPEGAGWSLRVPLTTSPRYVRADEAKSRHADGQPLAVLRDPGHRFALDLAFSDADSIASNTHVLAVTEGRVRLSDGEVLPDRDCVITWRSKAEDRASLRVWTHTDAANGKEYFLALCAPPKYTNAKKVPREVILLVDHSGSMRGAKWEAADWAVERFLAGLSETDSFALGLFHNSTKWFAQRTRRATPETVKEAVTFLKANRDDGGTELGVALEQALDRSRTADTPSRHVLVLTDGEVTDAGRVLRLADQEFTKPDHRRVSVLCIDSAPNEALVSELAQRGGGVSRFLTSNPDEDDVTTALDEVLADWSAPVLTGLTLEVNRAGAVVAGRTVALIAPGPQSAIDIGDLPAGRPVWVIGRVPAGSEALSFHLRTGAEVVAEQRMNMRSGAPGLQALFGADRVRRLEYVMHANFGGEELRAELARLSYESTPSEAKVYAENARDASAMIVRDLLVRESLASGVPCSETALVAVRSEVGKPVTETRVVGNALPHGWSEPTLAALALKGIKLAQAGIMGAAPPPPAAAIDWCLAMSEDSASGTTTTDCDAEDAMREAAKNVRRAPRLLSPGGGKSGVGSASKIGSESVARPPVPSARGQKLDAKAPTGDVHIAITAGQHARADGTVLFDSPNSSEGQYTFLSVSFADKAITADSLDPELAVLLFVGDLAAPRARVKLADVLRQGSRRPLNIRVAAGETVRLTLADPSGVWAAGVPALEMVLGWKE